MNLDFLIRNWQRNSSAHSKRELIEELTMKSLYLQELTSIRLRQEVIQKLAKCDPEIIELEGF